ncbi:MAG: CDP-alcohol phosphatidyltransferase family protein [Candidatus Diapherotrites archaeon]|uniref:CDP-alcohol phosphatidyltransferase family protein n=1 Tax=Candidatus Iainarchaeum sp. TaxID=3101447 RepID=A0A8T4L4G2_9ARCH|nr:CDP-alcohol phosphatidyltransferase family protein [Candidatus Diapherotrites archaeon]
MLGEKFRKRLNALFFAIGKALSILPLTANQFTATSIILALIAAYSLYLQNLPLALVFVILAILVDVLDGSFAEAKKQKSNFGNYFDAIVDKVAECVFYIGFTFITPIFAILALAGTMLESYAKPRVGLVIISDNHDWPAVGERSDRLLVLILGLLAAAVVSQFLIFKYSIIIVEATLFLIFLLTLVGFAQRVHYARMLILKAEKEGKLLPYLRSGSKKPK